MSHFYGTLSGSRDKTITRCGTKQTGITTTARSWNNGVTTEINHIEVDGKEHDQICVYLDKGSNNTRDRMLIASILIDTEGKDVATLLTTDQKINNFIMEVSG